MQPANARTEFEGVDLSEALKRAAESLGIPEDDLDYEILEQGRRGLFGIGAKCVRIRVMPPLDEELPDPQGGGRPQRRRRPAGGPPVAPTEPAPTRAATPARVERRPARVEPPVAERAKPRGDGAAGEASERPPRERSGRRRRRRGRGRGEREASPARQPQRGERTPGPRPAAAPTTETKPAPVEQVAAVESTLRRMIELMGLDIEARVESGESGVHLGLEGPDRELLAANDGELLDALQFLLNRMSRRSWPDSGRIHLTGNGHETRRDEDIVALVREAADEVLESGRPRRLAPMNAYERRIVHITVREMRGVASKSEGEGSLKRVRIFRARGTNNRRADETDAPAED